MDDFPCDLNKVLSLNFDNLVKVINFLHQNTIDLNQKINDIGKRIDSFSELKDDLEEFKVKSQANQQKFEEMQSSVDNVSKNFLGFDTKISEVNDRMAELEKKLNEFQSINNSSEEKINNHETNLNNLNRVVEEHIKQFEKEKERIQQNQDDIGKLSQLNVGINNDILEVKNKIDESNKNIMTVIDINKDKASESTADITKKVSEMDQVVTTLTNAIQELKGVTLNLETGQEQLKKDAEDQTNQQQPPQVVIQQVQEEKKEEEKNAEDKVVIKSQEDKPPESIHTVQPVAQQSKIVIEPTSVPSGITTFVQPLPTTIIKESAHDWDSVNQRINSIIKETDLMKYQHSQDYINLTHQIKDIKDTLASAPQRPAVSDKYSELNEESLRAKEPSEHPVEIPDIAIPAEGGAENNSEVIKKITETLRVVGSNLNDKASKGDLQVIARNIEKKLALFNDKIKQDLTGFDARLTAFQLDQATGGGASKDGKGKVDLDFLVENVSNRVQEQMASQQQKAIQDNIDKIDITKNPNIESILKDIEQHTEELNKTYESIVDIRKNLLSKTVEENVAKLMQRMNDAESTCRKLKFNISEFSKIIEGDEGEEGENNEGSEQPKGGSIRDNLNLLNTKFITLHTGQEKIEKKIENLNRDILSIVKRDLKAESTRLLDEFKSDLKMSITKIEEQLRNKVDRFGLMEFGQKIDSKFSNDLRSKIDRTDMSKNNHQINRKIDSLENKISRTLVDTLIDLQLDEAPLIVKKNMKNVDRCASCNQVLPNNNNHYINCSTDFAGRGKVSTSKFKLPDINP